MILFRLESHDDKSQKWETIFLAHSACRFRLSNKKIEVQKQLMTSFPDLNEVISNLFLLVANINAFIKNT